MSDLFVGLKRGVQSYLRQWALTRMPARKLRGFGTVTLNLPHSNLHFMVRFHRYDKPERDIMIES